MQINAKVKSQLTRLLGEAETGTILLYAGEVNATFQDHERKLRDAFRAFTEKLLENAAVTGRLAFSEVDFTGVVVGHSFDVMRVALNHSLDFITEDPKEPEELEPMPAAQRLASRKGRPTKPPEARVPRNFKQLRIMWDMFRKKKKIPARQQALAQRIREAYLKKVQDMWVKHGEDFRNGSTGERKAAVSAIMQGADVAYSRAKMIVETETTYYYNKTRRAVYDRSSDVSHYLFMAIRDHRTTEWCKTRHGLVYAKDDPILNKEQPPCHWNCRSEVLPMTKLNPRHLKIIQDPKLQRRKNRCEPLPPEWGGR